MVPTQSLSKVCSSSGWMGAGRRRLSSKSVCDSCLGTWLLQRTAVVPHAGNPSSREETMWLVYLGLEIWLSG